MHGTLVKGGRQGEPCGAGRRSGCRRKDRGLRDVLWDVLGDAEQAMDMSDRARREAIAAKATSAGFLAFWIRRLPAGQGIRAAELVSRGARSAGSVSIG